MFCNFQDPGHCYIQDAGDCYISETSLPTYGNDINIISNKMTVFSYLELANNTMACEPRSCSQQHANQDLPVNGIQTSIYQSVACHPQSASQENASFERCLKQFTYLHEASNFHCTMHFKYACSDYTYVS